MGSSYANDLTLRQGWENRFPQFVTRRDKDFILTMPSKWQNVIKQTVLNVNRIILTMVVINFFFMHRSGNSYPDDWLLKAMANSSPRTLTAPQKQPPKKAVFLSLLCIRYLLESPTLQPRSDPERLLSIYGHHHRWWSQGDNLDVFLR